MIPRALTRPLIGAVMVATGLATAPALAAPALAVATPTVSVAAGPVLQPALIDELAKVSGTTPVRVMIQAGGSLSTAKQAVALNGLTPEITLDRIGIAVATGTPDEVRALATTQGVTRVDWADQPMEYFTDTSHKATRAEYIQDGAVDVNGDGVVDKFTGKGFSVAIVDSGADGTHPMFAAADGSSRVKKNIKIACHDIVGGEGSVFVGDDFWHTAADCSVDATAVNDTDTPSGGGHGTHVTGIAAGDIVTDTAGRHLRGAAPDADIVAISTGEVITVLSGVTGMYWVLDHHADPCGDGSCGPIVAVNNSWGVSNSTYSASSPDDVVARALVAEGVVVAWAAGNDGGDGSAVATNPYGLDPTPGIISVANYDDANTGTRDNDLDSSSSRGMKGVVATYPDISAPGANITSACRPWLPVCSTGLDTKDPNYNTISGTSMATPHITGYVALLQQVAEMKLGRMLTPAEVENLLVDTAYHFGNRTWETDTRNPDATSGTTFDAGHGLVDMAAAVEKLTGKTVTIPAGQVCAVDARFTDPEGDATGALGTDVPGGPDATSLDITEGWLTSDLTTSDVTFHWKVADLTDQPGGTDGTGEYFDFNFSLGGAAYYLGAYRDLTSGESFAFGDFAGTTGGRNQLASVPGSFDPTTDEITVTLPVATWDANAVKGALAPGAVISGLTIIGRRDLGVLVPDADTAKGSCSYTIGAENVPAENTAPTAWAVATPTDAETGAAIALDATNSTDAETPDSLTYSWDFGDGGDTVDATTPTASVSYPQAGDYTVTLTVTDEGGLTGTDSVAVHVTDPPAPNTAPTASATVDPTRGTTDTVFGLDASGSTDAETPDALTYSWDFGNGGSSVDATGEFASAVYQHPGVKRVTLTVTDAGGLVDTTSLEITVMKKQACEDKTVKRQGWKKTSSSWADGGSFCSSAAVDKGTPNLSFTTRGDFLAIAYGRSQTGGVAKVLVDGTIVGRLVFRTSSKRVVFGRTLELRGLGTGKHNVVIRMTKPKAHGFLDYFAF